MLKKIQRKALISALLFSLILSVVSCGSSDENDDDDNNKSRKNTSDTSIISDESESGDSSSQETIESEWKSELAGTPYDLTDDSTDLSGDSTISDNTEPDYYAYYDELSYAYYKADKDINSIGMIDDDNILIPIFFSGEETYRFTIYGYSIANNTLDIFFTTDIKATDDFQWRYINGDIYISYYDYETLDEVTEKYQHNKKVASITGYEDVNLSMGLNNYFLSYNYYDDARIISNDLSEVIKIPTEMEVTIEHGLTESKQLLIKGLCEDYLIGHLYLDDTYYILDTSASSFEWVEANEANINIDLLLSIEKIYGNFAFTSNGLYNLSTEECISTLNTGDGYYGGNYNIINESGYWYKVKYPSCDYPSTSYSDSLDYKELLSKETSNNIIQLNNEYYIVMDDYGIFLRNYENGEAEEETIMLYSDFDYDGFYDYEVLS